MNGDEVKGGEKAEREGMMIVSACWSWREESRRERGVGREEGIEDACSNRYWPRM